jgi:glycosyltransferase involved in cell wall biosynthesis
MGLSNFLIFIFVSCVQLNLYEIKKMASIACLIMCKDEHEGIEVTLNSAKDWINMFVVFDTGSSDDTKDIIRNWCSKNNKELHMMEGKFVDFSVSRNALLDFADTFNTEYQLLLDSRDELRTGRELQVFCSQKNEPYTGFLIKQVWFCGNSTQSYFNVRLIKARHKWRYRSSVHEYIYSPEVENVKPLKIPHIILYQDRTLDNNKSFPRFSRDRALLWNEYNKNPKDQRTIFYMSQTMGCLGQLDLSYKYYKIRSRLGGFDEEVFHSLLRCGDIARLLKHYPEEAIGWYINSFSFLERAEPLLYLSDMFQNNKNWRSAYMFCKMATLLDFPEEAILFVDRDSYDYKRWSMFAVIAFNYSKTRKNQELKEKIRQEALDACNKAIEFAHKDIDIKNRKIIKGEIDGEPTISSDMGLISCHFTGCNNIPVGIQGAF